MFITVIFTLLFGSSSVKSPVPFGNRIIPALPLDDQYIETNRRKFLESARRERIAILAEIELYSKKAEEAIILEVASEYRQHVEKLRAFLPIYEQQARRLWELQPGGITAPAPRAIERRDSTPPPNSSFHRPNQTDKR